MRLLSALLLLLAAPAAAQSAADVVRVRLAAPSAASEVTVVGSAAPLVVTVDGRPVGQVAPGQPLRLRAEGREVRASGPGVDARGREVEAAGGTVSVAASGPARRYVGSVRATSAGGRLQVVNHAPLEDYVASVVASEYPFTEIEGVKAQAVLARTYALRRRGAQPTYDVDDHHGSQVYKGADVVTPVTRRAAEETAGEVLTYGADLADAVYSSSSGGHTADNESVWDGAPVPYLRGVPDPYDAGAPHHTWRTTVEAAAVHRALSQRFGGRVTGVAPGETSREGRAVSLRLDGARQPTISGSDFRDAVNAALGARTVRSTRFTLARRGGDYVLEGGGFGHGVGMSQYGARGQAREGRSYEDILAFYFRGTEVTGGTGGAALARVAAAPESYPVVRGSAEARRWPTPRRLVGLGAERGPERAAEPQETAPRPQRRAW